MRWLYRMDGLIANHMTTVSVLMVAFGVVFPSVFSRMTPFVTFFFACMTFCNCLGAGFREMWEIVRHPLPVLVTLALVHVVQPLIALGAGWLLFPGEPGFVTGLVLEFTVPTAILSLMWTDLSRGNLNLTLSIVLLDTLLSPFVLPLSLQVLLGSVVEIETWSMMKSLAAMVALPALAAMLLHRVSGGRATRYLKPRLSPFGKLFMILIGLTNSTGCAQFFRSPTPTLALLIAVIVALCLLSFWISYWAARWLKLDFPGVESVTLCGGMRNISAGSALALQYFTPQALFPVALTPTFIQALASVICRLLRRTRQGQADQAAYERGRANPL